MKHLLPQEVPGAYHLLMMVSGQYTHFLKLAVFDMNQFEKWGQSANASA